jgi:segregation and condensation protein B
VAKARRTKDEAPAAADVDSAREDVNGEAESSNGEDALEQVAALSREDMKRAIYALLFASDRPLSVERLAEALGDVDQDDVEELLGELGPEIQKSDVPFQLRDIAGGFQLTSEAKYAPYIRRLFQLKKKNKLSKAVLETLAIIAYRQPVTRPDVESIRGVSVSHAFTLLQERRLIKAVGVAEVPGRPRLYRTTDEFLLHFGLRSIEEMPTIEELREMV